MEFDGYIDSGYYSGEDLSSILEKMIKTTKKWLIIVSPFVRISGRIKGYIEKLLSRKIEIILVYKTNYGNVENIKREDYEWLTENKIQVKSSRNLHAKCYINDDYALVTSMNLVDYSLANNFEMGVVYNIVDDCYNNSDIYTSYNNSPYRQILDDVLNINCDGSSIDFNYDKYYKGYCIRTGVEIPFNIDKPMCDEAWEEWCKTRDPDRPENYCHYTGEKSNGNTCVRTPIMHKNYQEAHYNFYFFTGRNRDTSEWDRKKIKER